MSRPILSMSEHKAQAAARKEARARKRAPIPKVGQRKQDYHRWERAERAKAKGKPCPICGRENLAPLPARHLVPQSLAPALAMIPENVRFPCVRCPEQPEDVSIVKGNLERRAAVIRERYGPEAEEYMRANWPGRKE